MSKIDDIKNQTFNVDEHGNITNVHKQLSPLEALYDLFENPFYIELGRVRGRTQFNRDIQIIEKALKDNQKTIDKLSNEIKHLKATDRRNKKKLKDYELLKKCLYVGKSGAIAITSYGFDNHDLLEEILK